MVVEIHRVGDQKDVFLSGEPMRKYTALLTDIGDLVQYGSIETNRNEIN